MAKRASPGRRSRARELIVQSLYQMQIADHDADELLAQFRERPDYNRVDQPFYEQAITGICGQIAELEKRLEEFADRPLAQLDPVEKGILLLGIYELFMQPDVPFKVVINESVNLAKRFGAADGHKYINAVLDRAVKEYRSAD
jgi:N utilization substance protein B